MCQTKQTFENVTLSPSPQWHALASRLSPAFEQVTLHGACWVAAKPVETAMSHQSEGSPVSAHAESSRPVHTGSKTDSAGKVFCHHLVVRPAN